MTPAARIQAVIDILTEMEDVPRPADTVANLYFRARRYIGSKDRAAVSDMLYSIMRKYHRLGWWIARAGAEVTPRTLAIAEVMFAREHIIGDIFSGGKYTPEPLSGKEDKLAHTLKGQELEHPDMSLREKGECPAWAFESLHNFLGDKFEPEMRATQKEAQLDVRVNTIKATREEILEDLRAEGFEAEEGKLSPFAIRMKGRPRLMSHGLYTNGYIEVQDEGSQMVVVLADPQPGEQVADFCAGAGGKTLALGAVMQNKGRIVAMDVLGRRLEGAKERFRRADLHNIETREITGERDKYIKRSAGKFDLVLIDAPCTGSGTWRRDPGSRWRQLGPGLEELTTLQENILDSACRMVKPGGRLVYATCSLLREENEAQVEKFLETHKEFTLRPAREIVKAEGIDKYMRLSPAVHDTDGFFGAVLVREGQADNGEAHD